MDNRYIGGGVGSRNGHGVFERMVSIESLFKSWRSFREGKSSKGDVQEFEFNLEDNIFELHRELTKDTYRHSGYFSFHVYDPKLRHIHKPLVRDRIVHHAIVRVLEEIFEPAFIHDSYASREGKGTHKGFGRLKQYAWKLSQNNTKTVYCLKGDVRKFFDSMDHAILIRLLEKRIKDERAIALIREVIGSFEKNPGKGLPLGNLTSQLFSSVYLNELDQFLKRELKVKYYIRYSDDFVVLSRDEAYLHGLLPVIKEFLEEKLELQLHPNKISFLKWHAGIDFLGYIALPYRTLMRIKTKKRILRKVGVARKKLATGEISQKEFDQSFASYLGALSHADAFTVKTNLLKR